MNPHIELPTPLTDAPEFWLGRLREVAAQEATAVMSRDRAMKRIQAILREMEEHERGKTLRAAALVHEINRQA